MKLKLLLLLLLFAEYANASGGSLFGLSLIVFIVYTVYSFILYGITYGEGGQATFLFIIISESMGSESLVLLDSRFRGNDEERSLRLLSYYHFQFTVITRDKRVSTL
jgi:hypothetical protein